MATVCDSDFLELTNELGPDELHHLFHELGISQRDIEHAERSVDTPDTRLKARAVLHWWRRTSGSDATRDTLMKAKRKINVTRPSLRGKFYIVIIVKYNMENKCHTTWYSRYVHWNISKLNGIHIVRNTFYRIVLCTKHYIVAGQEKPHMCFWPLNMHFAKNT